MKKYPGMSSGPRITFMGLVVILQIRRLVERLMGLLYICIHARNTGLLTKRFTLLTHYYLFVPPPIIFKTLQTLY